MGYLTDLLNKILEFFEIKPVEPVVPEEPPKPREPAEAETPLPPKEPIEPVEEPVQPLPIEPIAPTIGEEGRRQRIEKPPAKPEPYRPKKWTGKTLGELTGKSPPFSLSDMTTCPSCGKSVGSAVYECPYCGYKDPEGYYVYVDTGERV